MKTVLQLIKGPELVLCNYERRTVPVKKEGPVKVRLACRANETISKEKDKLLMIVDVISDTPGVPFKFEIKMQGEFKIDSVNEEDLKSIGRIEAFPIIFMLIRELIADLTRKSFVIPLVLQFPVFDDVGVHKGKKAYIAAKKNKQLAPVKKEM